MSTSTPKYFLGARPKVQRVSETKMVDKVVGQDDEGGDVIAKVSSRVKSENPFTEFFIESDEGAVIKNIAAREAGVEYFQGFRYFAVDEDEYGKVVLTEFGVA